MPVGQKPAGFFMMGESVFNPDQQEKDISSKIVAGLERISEVFKVLLWEKAKMVGLSPIQIQMLIFIAFHKQELCNVSHLAKEFNITKPTVSDAIKVLDKKKSVTVWNDTVTLFDLNTFYICDYYSCSTLNLGSCFHF